MDLKKPASIQKTAATRLQEAGNAPRRLARLHTGVMLGASVLLTVLSYLAEQAIDTTGGLAGIGPRTLLTTAQTVLLAMNYILLPFWSVGFQAAALELVRGAAPEDRVLIRGFQRFGAVLGLLLLQLVLTIAAGFLSIQVCSWVFLLTPFSQPARTLMDSVLANSTVLTEMPLLDDATMAALMQALLPAEIGAVAVFAAAMLFLRYRFRMAEFAIMEQQPVRGLEAFMTGLRRMRRRTWQMLRLDLHFWWYYLAQALLLAVGNLALLLLRAGIALPVSNTAAQFLCFGAQVLGQYFLFVRAKPLVEASYAVFYTQAQMPG